MRDEMIDKGVLPMEKYIPFAFRAGVALGARQAVDAHPAGGKSTFVEQRFEGQNGWITQPQFTKECSSTRR